MASASAREKTFSIITLGCAKNEVDSEKMRMALLQAGFVESEPESADAVIVNTCCFIQDATEESIEAILEASNLDNVVSGGAHLIVAGCMPARYGDDLAQELTEASSFVPCSKEDDIAEVVGTLIGKPAHPAPEKIGRESCVSAYVKISDGCDRFCSYCAIPYIRGRYHSFAYDDIAADFASAVDAGAKEVVLIAQDTGRWGQDFEEPSTLADLMRRLAAEFPSTWIRVMYIQPEGVTDELLRVIAEASNICSYLDVPMQHVDQDILASMNRHGSVSEYRELISKIRATIPDVTLRTTLIAGYPGESDEQFEQLCDFVEEGLFDYVGVFAYSQEEGTRAARLENQVPDDEKMERAQRLRDIADAISISRMASRVGEECDVLIEGTEDDGQLFGRAMFQAPDVDGSTYVDSGEVGSVVRVRICDTLYYEVEGEVI